MRSTKIESRVPNPIVEAVNLQIEQGIITRGGRSQVIRSAMLMQAVWGISNPFADRYHELSDVKRDAIDDFILALNQAGVIRRKRFVKWLEAKADLKELSFLDAGRRMMDVMSDLADEYLQTGELPDFKKAG